MKRRKFIWLLNGTAMGPLVARAQNPAIPVIGFVSTRSAKYAEPNVVAFGRGLAEAGYFEHDNVAIEYRWAEGHNDRVPTLMADLVRRPVHVIAAACGRRGQANNGDHSDRLHEWRRPGQISPC